jgi:hypothetical protein
MASEVDPMTEPTTPAAELVSLFLYSAAAIPLFYLPALFYGPYTNFAVPHARNRSPAVANGLRDQLPRPRREH